MSLCWQSRSRSSSSPCPQTYQEKTPADSHVSFSQQCNKTCFIRLIQHLNELNQLSVWSRVLYFVSLQRNVINKPLKISCSPTKQSV